MAFDEFDAHHAHDDRNTPIHEGDAERDGPHEDPAVVSADDERLTRESQALLQPLRLDAERFESLAQRIEAAAASELLRRATLVRRNDPSYLTLRSAHELPTGRELAARDLRHTPSGGIPVRTTRTTVAAMLARAMWPALATAAAAVLVAVGITQSETTRSSTSTDFIAGRMLAASATTRALAFNKPDAAWIAQQTTPSSEDLVQAIGLGVEQ